VILELSLLAGGLLAGVFLFWWLVRRSSGHDASFRLLEQTMSNQLRQFSELVDRRLQANVAAMNESERSVRTVLNSLGKLEHATAALQQTNQEITNFQLLLSAPKVRGSFGEILLANLLADVLPSDRYQLQYTFRNSRDIADAIIRLQDDYLVAIDAKFPLANFKTDRKAFLRDVKTHISAIASKYIVPAEKTLDYAFMYIPLEGVYYETMVHDPHETSLWEFCLRHKVIPVSPNSFLAYLQTILIGLRGLKLEKQTKDILRYLGQLQQDMTAFSKDFAMIGTHLTHAKNRYDDSTRRLDRLANRLDQLGDSSTNTDAALPEQSPESPDS
jgi:DNA recombination protein RmuC